MATVAGPLARQPLPQRGRRLLRRSRGTHIGPSAVESSGSRQDHL
jgi:hypothetical protein